MNVEWEPLQLPQQIITTLRELVTTATVRLALGERSAKAIRREVRAVAVRLQAAIRSHQATLEIKQVMGLRVLANSLHRDLVLEGTDVQP